MPTLIYLIGFMGSGKTTLGSIMANVIGYDFVDLDELLEKRRGQTIQSIFAEEGEEAFRRAEHTLISETVGFEKKIVAPGGGAFLIAANRALMLEHGLTVYLRLSVPLLVSRLRSSRHRPLLLDDQGRRLPEKALAERITRLLEHRTPFYEQSHLTIDIDGEGVGKTVDRIVAEIQAFSNKPG